MVRFRILNIYALCLIFFWLYGLFFFFKNQKNNQKTVQKMT